jgi:hypothetical protein
VIAILALRHLLVRKLRTLFLLLGFSLGVGVMIVLLSVGEAMLEQSRDATLIGGGELTILPVGIDIEAMRTGGISAMFFGIDRSRFLVRQVLGGSRHRDMIRAVSPEIEGKLLYLHRGAVTVPVRAGGEIPSRAAAVGAKLDLLAGTWKDSPSDSRYIAPTAQQLYDELDHLHIRRVADSTWAEWHYFNLVAAPDEWWYITYLVGGQIPNGRWGGQLLITHRRKDGAYRRFSSQLPARKIAFDTLHADLELGRNFVRQRDGTYRIHARSGTAKTPVSIDLEITPAPERYFPPLELEEDALTSGYVVPGLVANASGRVCDGSRCESLRGVPAYHDHNWGVWRDVTWEWGNARGSRLSILYGGVYGPEYSAGGGAPERSPFFLAVLDSAGVNQVLRFSAIRYTGSRSASGAKGAVAPRKFELEATRETDTLRLQVQVGDALATPMNRGSSPRLFLQVRGHFTLSGRLLGQSVADTGAGFFETYVGRTPGE